jgi:hypothetical protein
MPSAAVTGANSRRPCRTAPPRGERTPSYGEITALKQELAQQRAMAKPRQPAADVPSGLGTEALQAASTKASPGVVGSRPALRRLVEDERMENLRKKCLKGLLHRPSMHSEFCRCCDQCRAQLQAWEQHFFKYRVEHPHPTMGCDWRTLAEEACHLRDVLARLRDVLGPRSDQIWSAHLRRGPVFKDARFQPFLDKVDYASAMNTMGAAIGFLHAVYHCFLSMDEEHRSDVRRLPKIARPGAPEAPRRFFMDYMSDRYCNAVVADLTVIAFDLDDLGAGDGARTAQDACRHKLSENWPRTAGHFFTIRI